MELRGDRGSPMIRVWDTGPGIPPDQSEAVMRRFYRLDPSRHLPGTGLGLSLVAAIARLHGFVLTVGTRDGGGCEVVMRCPTREPADAERARGGAPAPTPQLAHGAWPAGPRNHPVTPMGDATSPVCRRGTVAIHPRS